MNRTLESLVRSYARLSRDVEGRINFSCDLNNDEALDAAEQEKNHLDQAFFVLSFAALEAQITAIACMRLPEERRRTAMRDADFERRWDAATKVAREMLGTAPQWETSRPDVLSWYTIRSDIAHGRSPSALADVASVIYCADAISATAEQLAKF